MFFEDATKKYLILDVEGNSASKEEERKVTQFSALSIIGNSQQEINMFNRNVNYISSYVQKLTKISLKKCKNDGFSERHMVEEIHRLMKEAEVVYAYGCDFDRRILRFMFKKYHLAPLNTPWIDIQKIVKEKLQPKQLRLSIVATQYGFCSENFHNALVDCYATLHLMHVIEEKEQAVVL